MQRIEAEARRALTIALALTAVAACGGTSPARSPGTDYGPPSPTTSQGETVGADGVSPADKLVTGPSVGSEGPKPAATPAGVGPSREKKKPAPPGRPAETASPHSNP